MMFLFEEVISISTFTTPVFDHKEFSTCRFICHHLFDTLGGFYIFLICISEFKLVIQDSLDGEPKVLLDPNGLSKDGTVSLSRCAVSENAKYLAYGLSSNGSDWMTIKVMRVEDKVVNPDTLAWVSILFGFSVSHWHREKCLNKRDCYVMLLQVKLSGISWTHDCKGFFYSRYPAPE